MNIDLFLTGHNEAGLICDISFTDQPVGVILDAQTQELTLEFQAGDTRHLNIAVETAHREKLLFAHRIYLGYLEDGLLMDCFELPLLYLNDPYGSSFGQSTPLSKPVRSVLAFEQFMKRCNFAQSVHRDNLGDEDYARSILRGVDPHALKYAPTLQRQLQMVQTIRAENAPQMTGLGGGATARSVKPSSKKSDEEER